MSLLSCSGVYEAVGIPIVHGKKQLFPSFWTAGKNQITSYYYRGHYWKMWTMGEHLIYQQNS